MSVGDTLQHLLADSQAVAVETQRVVAGMDDLSRGIPVPKLPWFPEEVDSWTPRWILLNLIEEIARHAGHADILREAIDGAAALPLMAAAENWPPSSWVQPWSRHVQEQS